MALLSDPPRRAPYHLLIAYAAPPIIACHHWILSLAIICCHPLLAGRPLLAACSCHVICHFPPAQQHCRCHCHKPVHAPSPPPHPNLSCPTVHMPALRLSPCATLASQTPIVFGHAPGGIVSIPPSSAPSLLQSGTD
jgi:hypothetical protein